MKIAREIGSLMEFEAWGGAVDTKKRLMATMTDEMAWDYIADVYCDEIPTATQVNDLLWVDSDEIYKYVGLEGKLDDLAEDGIEKIKADIAGAVEVLEDCWESCYPKIEYTDKIREIIHTIAEDWEKVVKVQEGHYPQTDECLAGCYMDAICWIFDSIVRNK